MPMMDTYEPELDGSTELEGKDTNNSELIGMLRWATKIVRTDILYEVSLLSQYQSFPIEVHL